MKKRVSVGYIYYNERLDKEDKLFLKQAKKKNIDLVLFNLAKEIDELEIEKQAKKCDIIFNNSAEDLSLEVIKMLEEFGKKVVDSSKSFYYTEDKWMFYLKCKQHNIPTPETNLLSENLSFVPEELEKFNHWPVVLKRVEGTCGEYVDRAENSEKAIDVIKKFWKKGVNRLPIIAQEYINSPCYRVTVIGDKIMQGSVKNSHGWKKTGVYEKKNAEFVPDKKLKEIAKKLVKVTDLHICGIDLLKKDNKWVVLEINSEPALDFVEEQREALISQLLDYLRTLVK